MSAGCEEEEESNVMAGWPGNAAPDAQDPKEKEFCPEAFGIISPKAQVTRRSIKARRNAGVVPA